MKDASSKPLKDIRVLDFTRVLSGPFCTALMADMGAEVIKIEPLDGDDYRHVPPYKKGESAFFLLMNRGKKSLSVNLKSESGKALVRAIAAQSDVVVENFKPGVTKRLGVDYDSLKIDNRKLVYASISGFGQEGPSAGNAAYDIIVQAASGLMQATGFEGQPPTLVGEAFADLTAGLFASWAVLVALFHRTRTGEGQYIDVAMFDCLLSMLPTSIAQFCYGGHLPIRTGDRHPISVPFGTFRARDGYFVLAVLNQSLFDRLLEVIGRPDLKTAAALTGDLRRSENEPLVRSLIESWSGDRTVEEVLVRLSEKKVPAGPIWTIEQALNSSNESRRQVLPSVFHPDLGMISVLEQPVFFSGVERGIAMPPPRLGEHSEAVLGALCGISPDAFKHLVAEGVVGAIPRPSAQQTASEKI